MDSMPLIVDQALLQTIKMGLVALQYQALAATANIDAQITAALVQAAQVEVSPPSPPPPVVTT